MALAIGAVVAQSATRFSASALDSPSRRVGRRRVEAPLSPEDAADVITQLVRDIRAEADKGVPAEVAVCCALEADLDAQRERVTSFRYGQGWDDVRFLELLANRLAHIAGAVSLATLTEAAAVAEYDRGAGSGQRSMVYILPGRGVTACYIEGGQIIRGAHGIAGALGHWAVRDSGPRCACGGYGHLGVIASAQSIVRAIIGRASASEESTAAMLRISGGRAEAMSAAQVVELAAEGDYAAQAVVNDAADALASALARLSLMLDPGVIVIGGALALAPPYYANTLIERLRDYMPKDTTPPQVAFGHLEPNAALIGAGVLASRLRV